MRKIPASRLPDCNIKLMSRTCNCYTVTFKGMTKGTILALKNALTLYANSPCAQDVLAFLNEGIRTSNDNDLKNVVNS